MPGDVAAGASFSSPSPAAAAAVEVDESSFLPPLPHHDVLIVGAGLSGIAMGYHLSRSLPGKSFAILESRAALGGTWSLFQYPGVRSDSDMFTLGFSFRPWTAGKAIAPGGDILAYLQDTAREFDLEKRMRFGHKCIKANWSTPEQRWNLTLEITSPSSPPRFQRASCTFLSMCSGYYKYANGFTPDLPNASSFQGLTVHPQHWPADLDVKGKRFVVLGSGATAVTLVPALVEAGAAHVTMLQRSPTYMVSFPSRDKMAAAMRATHILPESWIYFMVRWKNILFAIFTYWLCRRYPALVKRHLMWLLRRWVPQGFDVDTHLCPKYNPWDQRFCLIPDGDFWRALHSGRASIVTDRIKSLTPKGIQLEQAKDPLETDVLVTATGLIMELGGGMAFTLDGRKVNLGRTVLYRGSMLSAIPNCALLMGYTNASWTLKCELIAERVCRMLELMDEKGYTSVCVPDVDSALQPNSSSAKSASASSPASQPFPTAPLFDLSSGYVTRATAAGILPRQGTTGPWRLHQNYVSDLICNRWDPLEDGVVQFTKRKGQTSAAELARDPKQNKKEL